MEIAAQFIPFILGTVYLALTIFTVVLALRFVTAHERIAAALETAAHRPHRETDQNKPA